MPPKRNSTASPTQPQVKMIKIGSVSDAHEFHSLPMEDKYLEEEEASSHLHLLKNEVKHTVYEIKLVLYHHVRKLHVVLFLVV